MQQTARARRLGSSARDSAGAGDTEVREKWLVERHVGKVLSEDWGGFASEPVAVRGFLPTCVNTAMQTAGTQSVPTYRLQVVFSAGAAAPRLEFETSRPATEACLWAVLRSEQVVLSATSVLRTVSGLIVRAKLFEHSGVPVSHRRAALLLAALRRCLERHSVHG